MVAVLALLAIAATAGAPFKQRIPTAGVMRAYKYFALLLHVSEHLRCSVHDILGQVAVSTDAVIRTTVSLMPSAVLAEG